MTENEVLVGFSTVGSEGEARALARGLVEAGVVACVNLVPGATSIYRWQGEVQEESEVMLIMKTRRGQVEALKRELRARHAYEVPELILMPVEAGWEPYLRWVVESTGGEVG